MVLLLLLLPLSPWLLRAVCFAFSEVEEGRGVEDGTGCEDDKTRTAFLAQDKSTLTASVNMGVRGQEDICEYRG
jgi:hypothetical protein